MNIQVCETVEVDSFSLEEDGPLESDGYVLTLMSNGQPVRRYDCETMQEAVRMLAFLADVKLSDLEAALSLPPEREE